MKSLTILVMTITLGIVGCDQSMQTNASENNRSDEYWYIADGELSKKFNGSVKHIDFTLIQRRSDETVVSGFVLYDVHHRGYNMLIHRRTRTGSKFLESWDFHGTQTGKSELSCFGSLSDYHSLPASLRLIAWAHAPFQLTNDGHVQIGASQWTRTEIPIAGSNLYRMEQMIDRSTEMPKQFKLWVSPRKLIQKANVKHIALIDQQYMPVSIELLTGQQETTVKLRNGAVFADGHSVNVIEAYRQYIDSPTDSCFVKQFLPKQLKQL